MISGFSPLNAIHEIGASFVPESSGPRVSVWSSQYFPARSCTESGPVSDPRALRLRTASRARVSVAKGPSVFALLGFGRRPVQVSLPAGET